MAAAAPLRVRIALHTGEADLRDGDYYGTVVNRCAAPAVVAHGGQVAALADRLRPGAGPSAGASRRCATWGRTACAISPGPSRCIQLLHPDLPAEFPPLRSLDALPNNLPVQITSFVGRERESAAVKALLRTTRLLSVTGPGGAGKTRLALQVAADLLEGDGDGVWLVGTGRAVRPGPGAAGRRRRRCGVREEPGRALTLTLCGLLFGPSGCCSCWTTANTCWPPARPWPISCSAPARGVTLLTTSRSPLGIAGETTFPVPSLSLPDRENLPAPESLSQFEAVQLFVEPRRRRLAPAFRVTSANAPVVAQFCHRLDGIPLALELAAARVRSLPVEQIAARLDDRFRLLTGGSRTALPRQQTLRALVDWSYALLSDREKTLLPPAGRLRGRLDAGRRRGGLRRARVWKPGKCWTG